MNRKLRPLPSQEILRERFDYHPDGYLTWKERPRSAFKTEQGYALAKRAFGRRASFVSRATSGWQSMVVKTDGLIWLEARLIWCWHTGAEPVFIDHANRNPLDNRIENLRNATPAENGRNRVGTCVSGVKGVRFRKGGWEAQIIHDRKTHYLGRFATKEQAGEAYAVAARARFGSFACAEHRAG